MKLCAVVLEIYMSQNFFHRHTGKQTFSKDSQIMSFLQQINPPKIGNQQFLQKHYFFFIYKIDSNTVIYSVWIRLNG